MKSLRNHSKRKDKTEMARKFKKTVEKQNQETIVLRFDFYQIQLTVPLYLKKLTKIRNKQSYHKL